MEETTMVSVICCAYNQEKYIEYALKSFIMQKTDFAYEVLVSDDASTDRTAEIIRRYEQRYPEIIRGVYFQENQYSKGNDPDVILYGMARGKYIAICEGDDYWTSEEKLQKQVDALEKHPECDMCAHTASMVRADDGQEIRTIAPMKEEGILTAEKVITGGGNYIATNSLLFRTAMLEAPAGFAVKFSIDYALQIMGALRGGIWYLTENMSAYRRGAENSWTLDMQKDQDKMVRHIRTMTDMLKMADEDTDHRYSECFQEARHKYDFQLAGYERNVKAVYSKEFADLRKELSGKERTILFLKCFAPWTLKLWQRMRDH